MLCTYVSEAERQYQDPDQENDQDLCQSNLGAETLGSTKGKLGPYKTFTWNQIKYCRTGAFNILAVKLIFLIFADNVLNVSEG